MTKFELLANVATPGFTLVERISTSPADSGAGLPPRHTPCRTSRIAVFGSEEETMEFDQRPFDLGVATLPNALLLAQDPAGDVANAAYDGPMMRYDGEHIIVSLDGFTTPDCLYRGHAIPRSFAWDAAGQTLARAGDLPSPAEWHSGEFVFLGDLYDHFGHFLLETLTRLWFLHLIPAERRGRLRFVLFRTWADPDRSMLWKVLELYGIDRAQVLVADRPMLFERLTVPSPAQQPFIGWEVCCSQTMEAFYRDLADRILRSWPNGVPRSERIYLSRERFVASGQGRRALTEAPAVEALYRAQGFAIVHPETLDLADQIRLVRGCREIAGPSGSAHHLAVFATGLERQTILTPPDFFLPACDLGCILYKGAALSYYFGRPRAPDVSRENANWNLDVRDFARFFQQHHVQPPQAPPPTPPSVPVWQRLAAAVGIKAARNGHLPLP